jgi:hypothetical protein
MSKVVVPPASRIDRSQLLNRTFILLIRAEHEAAFLPALNGMWVEMPAGRHFVVSRGGALTSVIAFEPKRLVVLRKPLVLLLGCEEEVRACLVDKCGLSVRCGVLRVKVTRRPGRRWARSIAWRHSTENAASFGSGWLELSAGRSQRDDDA